MTPAPLAPHLSAGARLVAAPGRALPLRAVALRVDARGGLARVVLSQRFQNPHEETLAVTYRLPLPGGRRGQQLRLPRRRAADRGRGRPARHGARALRGGDRRGAARGAARAGSIELLLSRRRSTASPRGAELVAEIVVDQRLAWLDEGAWEWRFPTAAAPRYYLGVPRRGRGDQPGGRPSPTPTPGVSRSTPPRAPLAARFLALAGGARPARRGPRAPESPSHALAVDRRRPEPCASRWPRARPRSIATSSSDGASRGPPPARDPRPRAPRGARWTALAPRPCARHPRPARAPPCQGGARSRHPARPERVDGGRAARAGPARVRGARGRARRGRQPGDPRLRRERGALPPGAETRHARREAGGARLGRLARGRRRHRDARRHRERARGGASGRAAAGGRHERRAHRLRAGDGGRRPPAPARDLAPPHRGRRVGGEPILHRGRRPGRPRRGGDPRPPRTWSGRRGGCSRARRRP